MKYVKKERKVLIIIFVFLLILRIPKLSNPPADYHNWRQSDTEMMAQNLIENNFSLIYPQLNYDGPSPNYAQLELPVTPLLIAALYKVFGFRYFLARLVPVFLFLASAYFLYLIALRFLGQRSAFLSLLLYGIFPFNIYFSRAIMPEAAALFFQLAGFYFFLLWQRHSKGMFLIASSLLIALAVMQKIPAVFILVPIAYLLFRENGWGMVFCYDSWTILLTAVVPALIYFSVLGQLTQADYVTGIASRFIPNLIGALKDPGAGDYLKNILLRAYSGMGLLFIIFLPLLLNKKRFPLGVWFLTMALETAVVVSAVQLDYYALFLGPPLALLGGTVLGKISNLKKGYLGVPLLIMVFCIILYQGYLELSPRYILNKDYLLYAQAIQEKTKKEDLLVIGLDNPAILNLSQRKGWRANINYKQDPAGELSEYKNQGADYFIMINNSIYGDEDGSYKNYLDSYFDIAFSQDGITIYKMN